MTIAQRLEQKGIEIGRREVMLKVVRNMRQNGMNDVVVMKFTGLTEDGSRIQ
ncbi:hypothetical protein [Symbiopectobacterium sp.]|uniref:hypothetical protein n=1 Tax=Symbiopectobacterium sp. TaxID=2952789 RepID=UPI003F3C11F7